MIAYPEYPEKKLVGWVCVYDDWDGEFLKTLDSAQVEFEDLSSDGIQGFMKFFKDGTKQIVTGYDYYFYVQHPNGDYVLSGNNHTIEDNEKRYPGLIIKRGKHTTDEWAHLVNNILNNYKINGN